MQNSAQRLIAIVEDDPFMAELVKQMIDGPEANAEIFLFANNFLQCPYVQQFSIIILDLSLPDIDGFDLLDMLAAKSKNWRILLMSGHETGVITAASLYAKGLGIHVLGPLKKPFSQDELRTAIGIPC
jgi:FixJ family two-component response regulator